MRTQNRGQIMNPLEEFIRGKYHNTIEKEGDVIVLPVRKLAFLYRFNDENFVGKPYDLSKQYLARGIRLVHVYEYEWVNNEEVMKGYLWSLIKRQHKRTVTEFEIKEIDGKEYSEFVGKYHLFTNQDKGAAVKLGMYDKDGVLISIAGFVHNKKYGWEWKRFVIRTDIVSQGFYIPDEFFAYFRDNYMKTGEKCVDFEQLDRFPDINSYTSKRFGFVKKGQSQGFMWLDSTGTRFTNYDFKGEKKTTALGKKNHPTEDWTAEQAANFYGFSNRIKKCGTVTWVYEK